MYHISRDTDVPIWEIFTCSLYCNKPFLNNFTLANVNSVHSVRNPFNVFTEGLCSKWIVICGKQEAKLDETPWEWYGMFEHPLL